MVSIIRNGLSHQQCIACFFFLVQNVLNSKWDLNSRLMNSEHHSHLSTMHCLVLSSPGVTNTPDLNSADSW